MQSVAKISGDTTINLRRWSLRMPGMWISTLSISLLLAIPLFVILGYLLVDTQIWQHLIDTVLWEYISQSFWLTTNVALVTLILGVSTAWFVVQFDFPGMRYYQWLLLLPLAIPSYILAFTYNGLLEPLGPLQTWLRDVTGLGFGDYPFPAFRNLGGASFILSLALYPYVYMLARTAFLNQSQRLQEVCASLGIGRWQQLIQITLPLARPAIAMGVLLVMMETLADYGAVAYLGVNTFSVGIFRTWLGLNDVAAAAQLAAILLLVVFALVGLENYSRRQRQFTNNTLHQTPQKIQLRGFNGLLVSLYCLLLVGLGFGVPIYLLGYWSWNATTVTFSMTVWQDWLTTTGQTFVLAAVAAAATVLIALLLTSSQRWLRHGVINTLVRLSSLGYAVPGAVIAVAVILCSTFIDQRIIHWRESNSWLLTGSGLLLIYAYAIRFSSVAIGSTQAGMTQINRSLDETAQTLGLSYSRILSRIHLPLLKTSLLTAGLLVFVDVLKELPITLVLRPFNTNTLAVKTFELAGDEQLQQAAPYALMIVMVSIIPVLVLNRALLKRR